MAFAMDEDNGKEFAMNKTTFVWGVLLMTGSLLLTGCGKSGKKTGTVQAPVGISADEQKGLKKKFKEEAQKSITEENAEEALKKLESEMESDQ